LGKRRTARERALQVLFELEFTDAGSEEVLARMWNERRIDADVRDYTAWLVRGIAARRDEVDRLIQGTSKNWRLSRMALVDRNILRIAAFELLEEMFLEPAIVINEAIEIAKRYSSETAAVFINGILDAVRKKLQADAPAAGPPAGPKKAKDHEPTRSSAQENAGRANARRRRGPAKV
jgi:N utilization substance protein B